MKVKAHFPGKAEGDVVGYYNDRRVRNGQVFELLNPSHFSNKWMKKITESPKHYGESLPSSENLEAVATPRRGRPPKVQDSEVI